MIRSRLGQWRAEKACSRKMCSKRTTAQQISKVSLPVVPCPHEGPIIETSKACRNGNKHIRSCNHPYPTKLNEAGEVVEDLDREVCSRVLVGPKAQACDSCNDHPTKAKS